MNAVPTDDLRVVKKQIGFRADPNVPGGYLALMGVVAVQRRWLVGSACFYEAAHPDDEKDFLTFPARKAEKEGEYVFERVREEWRDLPEAEI